MNKINTGGPCYMIIVSRKKDDQIREIADKKDYT